MRGFSMTRPPIQPLVTKKVPDTFSRAVTKKVPDTFSRANQVWDQGDFNYDNIVNIGDLSLLTTNWNAGVGSPLGPIGSGGDSGTQEFLRLCARLGLSERDIQWLLSILNTGRPPQL